jgi:hypothetical protein
VLDCPTTVLLSVPISRFLFRQNRHTRSPTIARTATVAPMPIPAYAPPDRPDEEEESVVLFGPEGFVVVGVPVPPVLVVVVLPAGDVSDSRHTSCTMGALTRNVGSEVEEEESVVVRGNIVTVENTLVEREQVATAAVPEVRMLVQLCM